MSLLIFLIILTVLFTLVARVLISLWIHFEARARQIEGAAIWGLTSFMFTLPTFLVFLIIRNRYGYSASSGRTYLTSTAAGTCVNLGVNQCGSLSACPLAERQRLLGACPASVSSSPYFGVGNNSCAARLSASGQLGNSVSACPLSCQRQINGAALDFEDFQTSGESLPICRRCWRGLLVGAGVSGFFMLVTIAAIIAILI